MRAEFSQLYLELSKAKRAGLMVSMSSAADRDSLRKISAYCRKQHGPTTTALKSDQDRDGIGAAEERAKALQAAAVALGLEM